MSPRVLNVAPGQALGPAGMGQSPTSPSQSEAGPCHPGCRVPRPRALPGALVSRLKNGNHVEPILKAQAARVPCRRRVPNGARLRRSPRRPRRGRGSVASPPRLQPCACQQTRSKGVGGVGNRP